MLWAGYVHVMGMAREHEQEGFMSAQAIAVSFFQEFDMVTVFILRFCLVLFLLVQEQRLP